MQLTAREGRVAHVLGLISVVFVVAALSSHHWMYSDNFDYVGIYGVHGYETNTGAIPNGFGTWRTIADITFYAAGGAALMLVVCALGRSPTNQMHWAAKASTTLFVVSLFAALDFILDPPGALDRQVGAAFVVFLVGALAGAIPSAMLQSEVIAPPAMPPAPALPPAPPPEPPPAT